MEADRERVVLSLQIQETGGLVTAGDRFQTSKKLLHKTLCPMPLWVVLF